MITVNYLYKRFVASHMKEKDVLIVRYYNIPFPLLYNLTYGQYVPFTLFPFHMQVFPWGFGRTLITVILEHNVSLIAIQTPEISSDL